MRYRPTTIRAYFLLLVIATVLPGVVFSGFLLWRESEDRYTRQEELLLDFAQTAAQSIEKELSTVLASLVTLSQAETLERDDLQGFAAMASRVRQQNPEWLTIVLARPDGEQLVNLAARPGQTPPNIARYRAVQAVVETQKPAVSDLILGTTVQTYLIGAYVPVVIDGAMRYVLGATLPATQFYKVLRQQPLPEGWIAGLMDGQDRLISRSNGHEGAVGTAASALWKGMPPDRVVRQQSRVGDQLLVTSAVDGTGGWRVGLAAREAAISAATWSSLRWHVALGLIVLATGLVGAAVLSRQIVRRLERVAGGVPALVQGGARRLPLSGIAEVDTLAQALADAVEGRQKADAARAQAEDTLRQAQKMESLGQMTGGIAHDFNNLLQIVLSSLAALRRRARPGPSAIDPQEFERFVGAATEGATRAGLLTQRLLAFARRQPLQPKAFELNKLVANMSEMLRRTLGENVAVETVLSGGLWRVMADVNQTEAALLNLAVNARDAMPRGGKLTIETANVFLDEAYARTHAEVAPGQYAMLAVSDTGTGMAPEVLAKAFEPFFTTKEMGQGTGLGLSQVYGFVKQSGGHVKIYSEPGQGTTIKIYLPRHLGEGEETTEPAAREIGRGRKEALILLVEDEPLVREQSMEMLKELGYPVIAVEDGHAALRALDAHPSVALLFTDIGLPGGMNGRQLADQACRTRPALKVLFATGYTRNAIIHHGRLDAGLHLLTKPFTYDALATKLAELLERPAA